MLHTVIEAIAEHLDLNDDEISSIKENTRLKEDLDIDSLDAVEISMILEDKLDIVLDEADVDAVITVGDLVSAIEEVKA